jgi:subtilisin family serine protease
MRTVLIALSVVVVGACGPRTFPSAPPPVPAAAPTIREAPLNWHLLDATADGLPGISLLRAERDLLRGREPKRTVIVAVIDNGVDTTHAALKPLLWANPRETPGNGRDDDNNGYADDIRGWNLLGGRDGRIVNQDTYEVTRLAALCAKGTGSSAVPEIYRQRCPDIQAELSKKRGEAEQTLQNVRQIEMLYSQILPYLRRAVGADSLTAARVEAIQTTNDTIGRARQVFLQLAAQGITPEEVAGAKKAYTSQLEYGYNMSFDPRPIVGDDYPDTLVKHYGNANVVGAGAEHGTHVAGIIASRRDAGGTGIAPSVRIMALRVVPDGDERDKDIALAIRYAVDQGAQVINMSFGKAWSPYKAQVDAAVRYADGKGVIMVHGAGNDGADNDTRPSFPNGSYLTGGRARHWIEVGASSWKGRDSLVANFSNYGRTMVDVFAPGFEIYSTAPGGSYKKQSGTSMASPVVAGLAALLLSHYPNLTGADVKRIILESATKLSDQMVARPGEGGGQARFGDLSATGGIVNAYSALRLAESFK